jgi:hypothetical protein
MMNNKIKYILFLCLLCCGFTLNAQHKTPKALDIYLLMGQSNMSGRGKITDSLNKISNDRVYMLDSNSNWVTAKHPVHFDKPKHVGVGPGLSFGIEMAKANPSVSIGLVPCAVGGTSISVWEPNALDSSSKKHPYDDALKRIKAAMKSGTIKGVIWHQGESDSKPKRSKEYLVNLKKLIYRIRQEVGNPTLPFIAGELGDFKPAYITFNEIIRSLPENVAFTSVVSSNGLKHKGDTTHFDALSEEEFGRRFSKAMLEVQKKVTNN